MRSITNWTLRSIFGLLILTHATPALAAPGELDASFGDDGRVSTDLGRNDSANTVAIQGDGKVVVAGSSNGVGGEFDFVLARYNSDGSPDASFGIGGTVTTDFLGYYDGVEAVAIQPDGKIIAAGHADFPEYDSNLALARYNPDGSLDATFGQDGKVVTTGLGGSYGYGLVLQPDGKIVLVGEGLISANRGRDFLLARYTAQGTLDRSFGDGGVVFTDVGGFDADGAYAAALQADGKIVAAGHIRFTDFTFEFALARYMPDGSLDAAFGGGGTVSTDFDSDAAIAEAVMVQPDGRIVAAGVSGSRFLYHPDVDEFALARYQPNGSLDSTFGRDGRVTTDFFGFNDIAYGLALQTDGRIVAAGAASRGPYDELGFQDFAVARYRLNGRLDATFGTRGRTTTDFFGRDDVATAVALQADGKIVAAGVAGLRDYESDFAVARYLAA